MGFDRNLPIKERILKRRRQKRKRLFIVLLAVLAFFSYIYVMNSKSSNEGEVLAEDTRSVKIQSNEETDGKIDMSSDVPIQNDNNGSESAVTSLSIEQLKKELESYISGFKGTYGIYYIDLSGGGQFGINDKEEYIAASTVKLPLNLYLYKMIKEGNVKRDGILTYKKEDYEEGTGEIRYGKVGKQYRIHELAKLSIEKSDNVATNMLFRFLEKDKVKSFMVSCGGMVVNKEENISCPRDMAIYMKLAYDFYKKDNTLGKELMGYLQNTDFNDRLPVLLPKDIKIAHKTGNQIGAVHDVGIIFTNRPYVLAIMSKEINEEQSYSVIANISKKVYDYQKSTE